MKTHLVTFATDDMSRSAMLCAESSKRYGVDTHARFTPRNIGTWDVVATNRTLFDQARGAGFWAWKSLVISKELEWLPEDSILIYSDGGVEFIDNVNYIIDRMDQDIFLFGNQWEHAHWCKRDVVCEIWNQNMRQLASNRAGYWEAATDALDFAEDGGVHWSLFGKQVQASVIFFRVNWYTRKFVKEWLDWCVFERGRLIDDSPSRSPNHSEFQENRHDQAILTTLAYREGIKLHWWPAVYNRFVLGGPVFIYERGDYSDEGYPVLFHHHRLRNHEWSVAA